MPPTCDGSIPCGSSSEAAQEYYAWIWSNYLDRIPVPRTSILWSGPFWIAIWSVVLIGFFFFYCWYLNRVHRKEGEMYGVSSFAGSILERIGRVATFSYIVWGAIALWALYFIVAHIAYGQTY